MKYASVRQHNLCNNDEVIDITGHDHPPVMDQLQDTTSSLLSSNTLSLLSSYILSLSSSNNSSRSLTSVRSKNNSEDNSLFPSSSQSMKICRSNSVDTKLANFVLSFCDWAMDSMSESIYNTPHQERCVDKIVGWKYIKNVTLRTQRMHRKSP